LSLIPPCSSCADQLDHIFSHGVYHSDYDFVIANRPQRGWSIFFANDTLTGGINNRTLPNPNGIPKIDAMLLDIEERLVSIPFEIHLARLAQAIGFAKIHGASSPSLLQGKVRDLGSR
jgi:hypothetical protein